MRIIFNNEQEEVLKKLKNLKNILLYSSLSDSDKSVLDYMVKQLEYVAVIVGGEEGAQEFNKVK